MITSIVAISKEVLHKRDYGCLFAVEEIPCQGVSEVY